MEKETQRMYPNRPDLMQLIPDAKELTVANLAEGGVIMTDNCDTARLFRQLFKEHITEVALKQGISPDQVHIHEADCWHHLRNTWIGTVLDQLSERLAICNLG